MHPPGTSRIRVPAYSLLGEVPYVQATDYAGLKWVGGYEDNPAHGMPYIRAKILLADPRNGDLRAVVAGDWISDMRTGAQPAIACKYLAASTDVVTIIGTGRQTYVSLLCMSRGLDIGEVRLCDLRPEARRRFMSFFPNAPFKMVVFIERVCQNGGSTKNRDHGEENRHES